MANCLFDAGGFPKSVCTSVNECICHGIPDNRQLQDGDILNIDVTVYLNVSCNNALKLATSSRLWCVLRMGIGQGALPGHPLQSLSGIAVA